MAKIRNLTVFGAVFPQVRSPVPNFTFIGAEYSPQNCENFEFWLQISTSGATSLQYFYEILRICMRL